MLKKSVLDETGTCFITQLASYGQIFGHNSNLSHQKFDKRSYFPISNEWTTQNKISKLCMFMNHEMKWVILLTFPLLCSSGPNHIKKTLQIRHLKSDIFIQDGKVQ